jgi:hypothetical protein
MDPLSVIVLALIYAALRAPGEAGRAVRQDYRGRRDRWTGGWDNRRRARGVAGYDRSGRGYSRDQRSRRRRGDPGWWRDPAAWRGREGRARVARGVRPSAIRTGIVTGALAYSALFGAGVAARGFARGLRGGYRLGKVHYRAKRADADGPRHTVTPGPVEPDAEIVDAEIVDDPTQPDQHAANAGGVYDQAADAAEAEGGFEVIDLIAIAESAEAPVPVGERGPDMDTGPWLVTVYGPGVNRLTGADSDGFAVYDAADLDRRLALAAGIPGLRVEVRPLPGPFEDSRPDDAPAGPITHPLIKEQPVDKNKIDATVRGSAAAPDGVYGMTRSSTGEVWDGGKGWVSDGAPGKGVSAVRVPVGAVSISAPVLMEGANYGAHLHNLNVIAKEARAEYASAELSLASASAARQRAEHAMAAVEQMAVGLAAQDFGETHVSNMASLHELLARHVAQARAAEQAAQESLATSEQLIELCTAAANVFQRDHGQLAEAHANAPHAAKTREAYQPM